MLIKLGEHWALSISNTRGSIKHQTQRVTDTAVITAAQTVDYHVDLPTKSAETYNF